MILLIDSGNSRLKVGWLDAPAAREPAAVAFDNLDPNALGDWLGTLGRTPELALGVNVAGPERGAGIRAALARHGCPVHWVTSRARLLHLRNGYTQPSQLGSDRLVALLGVLGRLPQDHAPFVLASFGTATTIDTVGADNEFIGGLILPGPALMRSSLARGTANLPVADGQVVDFPLDTHRAIASGIAAAQAGAVMRQWLAASQRCGRPAQLYVAGGGWPDVQAETEMLLALAGKAAGQPPAPVHLDRPVLDGLALLAGQPDPLSF